jgi:signal transduction histidine kinase
MAQKAADKGVTVTWTPNPKLNEVALDPKGIRRCLLNLVSNAVDACDDADEGCVEVCTEIPDRDMFCIKISDNGCGIAAEDKEQLFQMFFSTKGSEGTGLGLPVTHKIITEHNGEIAVDSKIGEGTTFIVTLPLRGETG